MNIEDEEPTSGSASNAGASGGEAESYFPALYDELRKLAAARFAARDGGATLQPTALVHEVWLKLAEASGEVRGREHFLAIAARAMRQVLADHARQRSADKRGGGAQRITLDEQLGDARAQDDAGVDLVALHEALARLERIDTRSARVAEMRLFSGLSSAEIGRVLGVTERTVQLDWRAANAWLTRELGDA